MLRLVKPGEMAPQNLPLREALNRVTRGSPARAGLAILDEHEVDALYRVLASRSFTQAQLDLWVERLIADHPHNRKSTGPQPGLWAWAKWVVFAGDKPQTQDTTESLDDWRRRAEAFIDEQIAGLDDPLWLERPLQALNAVRAQITHETGKEQWVMPVLRWALVQLLTISSADVASDHHATG